MLPATDLFLTGRDHIHDMPRGVTPLRPFAGPGVTCSLSTNNVLNPFTPYGDGSLLRMANLYANVAQVAEPRISPTVSIVTSSPRGHAPARLRLRDRLPADLVLLDAMDPAAAVAELPAPCWGMKAGRPTSTRDRRSCTTGRR